MPQTASSAVLLPRASAARIISFPAASRPAAEDDLPLRLLRHHTKNALQRILAEVAQARGAEATPAGRRMIAEVERRIRLSAAVSDALFGLTRAPRGLEDRLRSLCEATVELLGDPDQIIRLEVTVAGECPPSLQETLLRAAHEMVGNAVKHGLHMRLLGRIVVRLDMDGARSRLSVEDDGWGFAGTRDEGQGLDLLRSLAAQHGGTARLGRITDGTLAEVELPHAAS
ncbi:ATP-binding protein [Muricoccus radiodurans]|uniref:ATP-binding protein n=1 Tax=Muricoccus radiodurans TaxID=2231721 RepID=UPI003CF1257B